jgi:predicted negative regulator of RcsB-dependent stress response
LRRVARQEARNPEILEQIGDLQAGQKRAAEARAAYQSALDLKPERSTRKRIEKKLKELR